MHFMYNDGEVLNGDNDNLHETDGLDDCDDVDVDDDVVVDDDVESSRLTKTCGTRKAGPT